MAVIDIDDNRWPIVIITFSGKESREDMERFLQRLEMFQSRDDEYCFVIDLREMNHLSGEVREMLIRWLGNSGSHDLAGTAMVVSSPVMRLYLTMLMWWQKSRIGSGVKHKTVFSLNEAYEWSRNRLDMPRSGYQK
ncbi:STAS/SEC14 domain-containing protein [Balneolales bacterium ANBcel1]|nr:STAS/SEC14 domain-containing protein [Balneolales bacterium ANBcel1]